MTEWLVYALVGGVSGVMAGMFGIGGGLVIVPVLLLVFELKGLNPDITAHMAVATALAAMALNVISACYNQNKRDSVEWRWWVLAPMLMLGAVLGAALAGQISGLALRLLLACFLLLMSGYMLIFASPGRESKQGRVPMLWCQLAALGIGAVSAMVGIAGGTFLVPLLCALGLQVRSAVGTSSALGVPLVLLAAISHMVVGYDQPGLPGWTLGYVYLPAFLGIILVSPWGAMLGVHMAHLLPQHLLRRIFGCFLLLCALQVFWKLV